MNGKKLFIIILLAGMTLMSTSCFRLISTLFDDDDVTGTINADHSKIQYVGRFNRTDPERVTFDWPAVTIRAEFEGTSCAIRLKDNSNYYAVTIDDQEPQLLTPDTATVRTLATGLADTKHTIKVQKRTESFVGKGEFMGFILDDGKGLVIPKKAPKRRIEFIGNSITCGYGAEGKKASESFMNKTENATVTYAALVSDALDADFQVVAYSGRGVVRNYGDPKKVSDEPMPSLYDRTCCADASPKWDFSSWVPQAVVINLGTNDFSTQPHPDKAVFQDGLNNLIDRVQSNYDNVTVFCICGPMIDTPCSTYIEELVQQRQDENEDVFYIPVSNSIMTTADWGSDWHPNTTGHEKIAQVVLPVIQREMGW